MTHTIQENCIITGNSGDMRKQWCVFEHYRPSDTPGVAPELIFVNFCKLNQVFMLDMWTNNSEWKKMYAQPGAIMVRVIATAPDAVTAQRLALTHYKSLPVPPVCNDRGYNLHGVARPIRCSNGEVYRSQLEAAERLGLSQGHISLHMRGKLSAVKGYTFTHDTAGAGI